MKNIKLSNRLKKCAQMITKNAKIVDIGTDHAYIPIYLTLENKTHSALACDINSGPLENAKANIKKYHCESAIKTRLSDGLKNVSENEADEIIIAGMGGNMISNILDGCTWQSKRQKKFVLQPMKYEEKLRIYLAEKGYEITVEEAVRSLGKVYTVIIANFTGTPYVLTEEEKYIGKIDRRLTADGKDYIKKQIKNLSNHKLGAHVLGLIQEEESYNKLIKQFQKLLKEE